MKDIIDLYRDVVVQIATPYSKGTGFYLKSKQLIVTNEHVVRGNRQVVVAGHGMPRQLAKIIYTDPQYDLAFLEAPKDLSIPNINLGEAKEVEMGDQIVAIGHPFGLKFAATQGIISSTEQEQHGILFIHHDAALNPGNSGGPLINDKGLVIGVNTFIVQRGDNVGFSLPINYLKESLEGFEKHGRKLGTRCSSCYAQVFEDTIEKKYCPNCGAKVQLPSQVEEYEPIGVSKTIEALLEKMGYSVQLSRRGPRNWEVRQGSAMIEVSYHEKTGLIIGDAILCQLPKDAERIKALYEFLLRQNYIVENLTFSIRDRDIILSLLIHDRYLNVDTGVKLFKYLFEQADYYDNVLVEEHGAMWKSEEAV